MNEEQGSPPSESGAGGTPKPRATIEQLRALSEKLLKNFRLLPRHFDRKEVVVEIRRCSAFSAVSEGECECMSLDLKIGNTIKASYTLIHLPNRRGDQECQIAPDLEDLDLDLGPEAPWTIYACGATAVRLLEAPQSQRIVAYARTTFGTEEVSNEFGDHTVAHSGLAITKLVEEAPNQELPPAQSPPIAEFDPTT